MIRSKVSRVKFLERQEQERVASVDAKKMKQVRKALAWVSPSDKEILKTVLDRSPSHHAYLKQLLEIFEDESISRDVVAHAWHDRLYENLYLPWPMAPEHAKAHFEAEAEAITLIGQRACASSELRTGAGWAAAYWRYTAALACVIGEDG